MQQKVLDLKFKGKRVYLHSTDIYNAVIDYFNELYPTCLVTQFQMVFHKIITKQCVLLLGQSETMSMKPEDIAVDFTISGIDSEFVGYIIETNEAVDNRYEYNEDSIEKACKIDGNKVYLAEEFAFSPVEVIVCMNKKLHNTMIPPNGRAWLFTRLELSRLLRPQDTKDITVELLQNFHNRLTKASITIQGEVIGNIYYSLV